MLLSRKGHHYLKAVLFFAFCKKDTSSIKEISERLNISLKVLEQVLLTLKNKGVLTSKRGPQGGYSLARDVSDMTVMDVLELTGQDLKVLPEEKGGGEQAIDMVLTDQWRDIEQEIVLKLATLRIKDLVREMKENVAGKGLSYSI